MAAKEYIKHLIECKCILPQFKQANSPIWHHFIAFSEIDETGSVIPSFVQCNNCGSVHRVTEVGISTILGRDDMPSLPNLDEIKSGLPEKLVAILEKSDAQLPTYQETSFILEHKMWGRIVILNKETIDGLVVGKYLTIIGETLWKVNSFEQEVSVDV